MKICDLKTVDIDFEDLIGAAEGNASNDWEEDFVAGIKERYVQYKQDAYLSEKQLKILKKLAYNEK